MLGHRRLAIVDLSRAGHQPMTRGSLVITFNGMIYNYRTLRRELEQLGERFASDTDTEVLLAGWERWGQELLPRLRGMFAFAMWDHAKRLLVLVRDRFGKKPLVWKKRREGVVFASDLLALQYVDGERGAIDSSALSAYLVLKYVPEPYCILKGCAKVPAGCVIEIDATGARERRWYHPSPDPDAARLRPKDRAPFLRHRVESATRERLVADVPIGAFLSGGLDSAVVAAAAGRDIRTFTIGFEGVSQYYEERHLARATAKHLGTDHVELSIRSADALSCIDSVFDGLDEPFADSSAIPTYLVARAIRENAIVALSGDGGDEVFGGYRRHQGELLVETYARVPKLLRAKLIEPLLRALPESKNNWFLEHLRRARRFAQGAGLTEAARHATWMRALGPEDITALGSKAFDLVEHVANARASAPMNDPVSRTLFADIHILLPSQMLAKVDRMSMANAVEVRSPLLDYRVVETALAMPPDAKVSRNRGKAILRDAFADRLPPEVLRRAKKGFELPIAEWLRSGPWRALAEQAIRSSEFADIGLTTRNVGHRWLADLDIGRRDTADQVWTLVALDQWMQRQRALTNC
jgi:asparagine synthase (glutamine-hydrolysing)